MECLSRDFALRSRVKFGANPTKPDGVVHLLSDSPVADVTASVAVVLALSRRVGTVCAVGKKVLPGGVLGRNRQSVG